MFNSVLMSPAFRGNLISAHRSGRNTLSIPDNQTASTYDGVVPPPAPNPVTGIVPSTTQTVWFASSGTFKILNDPESRAKLYQDRITQHLTNRTLFEYSQYIMLAGTKIHLVDKTTPPDQAKGRGTLTLTSLDRASYPDLPWEYVPVTLKNRPLNMRYGDGNELSAPKGAEQLNVPCQAAHGATSPRPIFQVGEQEYAFAEGSSAYMTWNSTDDLPREVNDTDSILDYRGANTKLREKRLPIAQKVANGKLTPKQGIVRFIKLLGTAVNKLETQYDKNQPTRRQHRRATANAYQLSIRQIQSQFDKAMLDYSLLLNFRQNGQDAQPLRQALYPICHTYIRKRAVFQSGIHRQLLLTRDEAKARASKSLKNTLSIVRFGVLSELDAQDRGYFEEWWGQDLDYYEAKIGQNKKRAPNLLSGPAMKRLTNACKQYVPFIQNQERLYRSDAIQIVRHTRGWSRKKLAGKLGCSEETVTKIEDAKQLLSNRQVKGIAQALNVHPTNLFFDQRLEPEQEIE